MSTPLALNEQSIVCRTCLKVLESTGFAFIDDEGAYVKDVGSVREMLQFCIPELDLYVSTHPVICYHCLQTLVQVYNFKIKSLNVENTIKSYITRNNLQEYNHVNLNCVLMDDLKMKSKAIQIENRIKDMMLKELPENCDTAASDKTEHCEVEKNLLSVDKGGYNILLTQPKSTAEIVGEDVQLEQNVNRMEIKVTNDLDIDLKYENVQVTENVIESTETNDDLGHDNLEENNLESEVEQPSSTVVVRKDLFTPTEDANELDKTNSRSILLNSKLLNKNGKIIIKIDRNQLEPLTIIPALSQPVSSADSTITPPLSQDLSADAAENSTEVEASDNALDEETQQYSCNKCSFVTEDVIKIYDHNRTTHNFDYTCQHCPFSTSKVELLGKHMTSVHPQNMVQKVLNFKVTENYACTMCPFSVKTLDLLRSHHLAAHKLTDGVSGPIVLNTAFGNSSVTVQPQILKRVEYTCDICPYSTRDKSNLRKHLFTHGTKPLKCDHCSYKCVSPYQLRRHAKQKHAKLCDPRSRNQPYTLPDFKKENEEAMENYLKVTLDTIKQELEKQASP